MRPVWVHAFVLVRPLDFQFQKVGTVDQCWYAWYVVVDCGCGSVVVAGLGWIDLILFGRQAPQFFDDLVDGSLDVWDEGQELD